MTPLAPALMTSTRLRALLVTHASEATVTCTFAPGGKLGGVGIQSHLYCAHCSQGRIWHEVAAGLVLIVRAETLIRAVETAGCLEQGATADVEAELAAVRAEAARVLTELETAAAIADDCRDVLSATGAHKTERSE